MKTFRHNIGNALAGFGAGVQGRGGEFLRGLREDEAQLEDGRKQALVQDAFTVQRSLQNGDISGARKLLLNRLESIKTLGGNPEDTEGVLAKLDAGDTEGALSDVGIVVDHAIATGRLKAPRQGDGPKTSIVDGQAVTLNPDGTASAQPIEGFQTPEAAPKTQIVDGNLVTFGPDGASAQPIQGLRPSAATLAAQSNQASNRSLREREVEIAEQRERRLGRQLSASLEKVMLSSQDAVVESQRSSNKFTQLADQFEQRNIEGGIKSSGTEFLKSLLGTQDDFSEFRREFNQIRISQGLKNLPPGTASDSDVKLAMSGLPPSNASPEQITSFLRGAARLARIDAGYNQFKGDFISAKRDGGGLNRAWRSSVAAPAANDRMVPISRIYESAQIRGVSPEEILKTLGVTEDIFK